MKTEKKIEDYLHLYIGGEVETNIPGPYLHPYGCVNIQDITPDYLAIILNALQLKAKLQAEGFTDSDHLYCKLILRPLSSMTPEELREFFNEPNLTDDYCHDKIYKISGSVFGLYNAISQYGSHVSILWLLSMGFDLFELLPAGLAIDKNTL
jgi:hypothetical protein